MILDSTRQNCANCAYWEPVTDEHDMTYNDEGDFVPRPPRTSRKCLAAIHHDTYSDTPISGIKTGSNISVTDGSGYMAYLHTPPGHVCSEWGRKPPK